MDAISELSAALADHYAIEREIGRGGMATVYLARDVKHARNVALKVLDPELGAMLGIDRFLSEIKVTANLQHPNLLPLFDSGEAAGLLFYVMPYVEGESLRHRLDREKHLPIDAAVHIAVSIANALDYAHRHGIIHRDLKPDNILLHDGQPLVADFGIALAVSKAGGQRVTRTGLSLGTPQYMSPEQANGDRAIDGRTDIYSLGALTYEMLSGEPPHTGATAQAIIARLMTEEPRPLATTRRSVPPHVDAAVRRALEKLPADRFATAKDFADALQGRGTSLTVAPATTATHPFPLRIALIGAAAVALTAVAVAAGRYFALRPGPGVSARFAIDGANGQEIVDRSGASIAISPDGKMLAFLAETNFRLFLRRLDRLEAIPVPQSSGALDPKFSPDGKSIVYTLIGTTRVMTAPIDAGDGGAAATTSAELPAATEGVGWGHLSDPLAMARGTIWRISKGGIPRAIASNDTTQQSSWNTPWVFPGGKTIALRVTPRGARYGSALDRLGLISVDGSGKTIVDLESQNVLGYIDGILIFGRVGGRIMATRFDLDRRRVIGDAVTVVDGVIYKPGGGVAAAVSDNGTLAYLAGTALSMVDITDEHGKTLATLPNAKEYRHPAWSPDGKRFAIEIVDAGRTDVWVYDRASRVLSRLTQTGDAYTPAWTPDGKRLAFLTVTGAAWWMASDGGTPPELLPLHGIPSGRRVNMLAFTPDGHFAVVRLQGASQSNVGAQLTLSSLVDDRQPTLLIETKGGVLVGQPAVSPDGRWLSYNSEESGANELYVRSMGGSGRVQITSGGGTGGRWAADGRRLFFRTAGAVHVATLDLSGSSARVVRIDSLFPAQFAGGGGYGTNYSPRYDGKEFVHMRRASGGPKVIVVTNWMNEVRAKLGEK